MKKSTTVLATAIGLAFGSAAFAGAMMSKPEHSAAKDSIAARYKSDKAGCDPLAGNGKDICMAEARGREKVALAELQATYKPSDKARYEFAIAKANAAHSVAKEKCDDRAGNAKDVCLKEAASAQTAAKADAKARMKTADVRKDAAEDKRAAEYAVAKEKCAALAGNSRELCVKDAKAQYGQS